MNLSAGVKIALSLLAIAAIAWISGLRTALPQDLASATYFSPLHLFLSWWRHDEAGLQTISHATLDRAGLWQQPALLLAILGNSGLVVWLVRKS